MAEMEFIACPCPKYILADYGRCTCGHFLDVHDLAKGTCTLGGWK